ncbi:MAG TPA: hypothetical protein VIJ12_01315 [Candidatus Baltobacteraceae bacterium]
MRRLVGLALTVALAWAPFFAMARADAFRAFTQQPNLLAAYARATFATVPADLSADHQLSLPSHLAGLAFFLPPRAGTVPRFSFPTLTLASVPTVTLAYDRIFRFNDALDRYAVVRMPKATVPRSTTSLPRLSSLQTSPVASAIAASLVASVPNFAGGLDEAPRAAFDARLQDVATAIPAPVRVGSFTLSGSATSNDFTTIAAHDAQLAAGTTVRVSAGRRQFNVSVGSDYERLTDGNALTFAQSTQVGVDRYERTSSLAQLPGGSPALLIPSYADVTSRGINAGVAVPVNHSLTVGVGYGTRRFTGSYGASFAPNLDASNYSYLGNITFSMPRSSSAITLSARQNRYQDNLTPFSVQQTRADLNFTVKF